MPKVRDSDKGTMYEGPTAHDIETIFATFGGLETLLDDGVLYITREADHRK